MGNAPAKSPDMSPQQKMRRIKKMDAFLRRKMQKRGSKFNLKVVVRGKRGTGKTSLVQRLQAKSFSKKYIPTRELQTAHVNWNYKTTSEVVKMEVWDVVDVAMRGEEKGTKPKSGGFAGLESTDAVKKWQESQSSNKGAHTLMPLDATTIDVYKNTDVVIFMVDPFKRDTFTYAQQELSKVPLKSLILVLLNFRDKVDEKSEEGKKTLKVTQADVDKLISEHRAQYTAATATEDSSMTAEDRIASFQCSVANCFGLKVLYNYFNLPFLYQKRELVLQTLQDVKEELNAVRSETGADLTGNDYDRWVKWLDTTKKGAKTPQNSKKTGKPQTAPLSGNTHAAPSGRKPKRHKNPQRKLGSAKSATMTITSGPMDSVDDFKISDSHTMDTFFGDSDSEESDQGSNAKELERKRIVSLYKRSDSQDSVDSTGEIDEEEAAPTEQDLQHQKKLQKAREEQQQRRQKALQQQQQRALAQNKEQQRRRARKIAEKRLRQSEMQDVKKAEAKTDPNSSNITQKIDAPKSTANLDPDPVAAALPSPRKSDAGPTSSKVESSPSSSRGSSPRKGSDLAADAERRRRGYDSGDDSAGDDAFLDNGNGATAMSTAAKDAIAAALAAAQESFNSMPPPEDLEPKDRTTRKKKKKGKKKTKKKKDGGETQVGSHKKKKKKKKKNVIADEDL